MESATLLRIDQIHTDLGTQMRVMERPQTVDEYVEAMERGCQFPPITVFTDGHEFWLADGFHRLAAFRKQGLNSIPCFLKEGTFDDAREFACCANQDHGLPRSAADKRKAVEQFFTIPGRDALTNSEIARRLGVSGPFVKEIREGLRVKASPASHIGAGATKRKQLNGLIKPVPEGKELNGLIKSPKEIGETITIELPTKNKHEFVATLIDHFDAGYLKVCNEYLGDVL